MRVTAIATLLAASVSAESNVQVIQWVLGSPNKPMQDLQAAPGDELRFEWDESNNVPHNVFVLKKCNINKKQKWNKFQCGNVAKAKGKELATMTDPEDSNKKYAVWPVPATKDSACFICTYAGHCDAGQHSSLKIVHPPVPVVTEHQVQWSYGMVKSQRALTVTAADKINFVYRGGHNVWKRSECPSSQSDEEFDCEGGAQEHGTAGPFLYDLVEKEIEAGERLCFYCEVGSHCSRGNQYLVVDVVEPIYQNIDAVKAICDSTKDNAICKLCGGKLKKNKCKVKAKNFAKLTCAKIKDQPVFCAATGCTSEGNSCSGTLGAGL